MDFNRQTFTLGHTRFAKSEFELTLDSANLSSQCANPNPDSQIKF